ncbi:nucleopolyhedrovirus P10 family protein [Streptomyces sp. NPDC059378]|uniref:nucleopolyhedrovirus P10 family protein n=1 Tax=unclassified Streptomyces TaxID=2593676 RepID=UPI0036552B59
MTADRIGRAVRDQLSLGRLLPLGGPGDGAWITQRAAEAPLRRAAQSVPGVYPGALGISLADPGEPAEPVVPPPPGAVPPGPLRVTADFATTLSGPLPATASLVRATLGAAAERLGLAVAEVDLRVTGLLEEEPEPSPVPLPEPPAAGRAATPDEERAAAAASGVAGVERLTGALGGRSPVQLSARSAETPHEGALPRRHARVEIAVRADHRALDVARAVRTAVGEALPDHPTVTVLVTVVG